MNHSEIGVIGTNLAIERGPHIVGIFFWMLTPRYPKCRRVVHDVHDGHLANTGRPDRRSQRTPCDRQRLVCLHPSAASHPRRCHWVDVHRVGRRVYIYTHILVGGLEHFIFPYIGKTNPNWRTHIFQRGRYTTNRYISIYYIYCKLALLELATWPTCTGAPPVTNLWWLIPSWPVATGPLVTWLVRRRLEQTLRSFGWADAEIARNCWDVGVPWAMAAMENLRSESHESHLVSSAKHRKKVPDEMDIIEQYQWYCIYIYIIIYIYMIIYV